MHNVRNVTDEANLAPAGDHESLTIAALAQSVTVPDKCTHILYTVSGAPLRMRFDGVAPVAGVGLYLGVGAAGMMSVQTANAAQFIRDGATSGQLDCQPMAY